MFLIRTLITLISKNHPNNPNTEITLTSLINLATLKTLPTTLIITLAIQLFLTSLGLPYNHPKNRLTILIIL